MIEVPDELQLSSLVARARSGGNLAWDIVT